MTPPASGFQMSDVGDIRHATMGCISSFEACLSVKLLMKESWAESRLADMNLWASGVGALARPEASLDRRLQFQPKPQLVLTNLLLTLQEFIESCYMHALNETHGEKLDDKAESEDTAASPAEKTLELTPSDHSDLAPSSASWFIALGSGQKTASDTCSDLNAGDEPVEQHSEATLKKAMKDIDDILDQLIMLGLAIRKSGTAARLQKADASFNPNGNEDLRTHLEFILRNDAAKRRKDGGDKGRITAEYRMRETDDFGLVTPEQQHLILANLRRRHRFRYARRHQQKLDQLMVQPLVAKPESVVHAPEDHQESALWDDRPQALDDQKPPSTEDSPIAMLSNAPSGIPQAEMSATTPSAAKGDIVMTIPSQAAASHVSVSVATMHYPSPPPITKQMRGFKCPCCYQTLPEMFQDWSRWRKHLTEDLCPYTCPFLECPRPEVLYISRAAWRDHVLETHGAGHYWECLACSGTGTPNTFPTAEEFVSHNRTQHQGTISEDQITDLKGSCRKVAAPNISQCPLCSWPQDEEVVPDAAANLEHVGNCIHEFSLNSLPWAESLHVEAADSSSPFCRKVQEWFIKITEETEDLDIRKIDIKTFGVLPEAPWPRKQEGVHIPEEYFAENSKESSQVEPGSLSSDTDLPEFSYVAVLVDGDGARFHDDLLKDPEEGATNAALAIRQHVAEYVKDTDLSSDITIFARVFANVKDLAHSLRLSGIISYEDTFLKFVAKFTNARAEFDFVDVGYGKEHADSKIRQMLEFYHDDICCKKIFFVACHDAGYAHDLRPYIDDQGSRLVLVETTPAAPSIKKLGLPIITFDNVFRSGLLQNETRAIPQSPPKQISPPSPPPRVQPPVAKTTVTATTTAIRSGSISTKYKGSYAAASSTGNHQDINVGTAKSKATKVMEFNQDNVRLDPPAKMPGNTLAQNTYKQKLAEARNQAFCNGHYLSGSCSWGTQCTREHDAKLTADEMVIHRYMARSCPCFTGPGCLDFDCPMSHHCPQDPFCTRGNECKFKNTAKFGDMHLTKAGMRPVKRWTEGCEFPEPIVT